MPATVHTVLPSAPENGGGSRNIAGKDKNPDNPVVILKQR
jgi:hypothetical protein